MSIFNDKALKSVAEAAAKIMAETSHGTHPKTPKEKSLAALAHPKDKITHKDVLVGRGVLKKEDVKLSEDDTGYQDRYAVKNGKAVKHNPARGERDEPHHVWADSAEHAVRKHAAKTAAPMKEETEQLQEYESKGGVYKHKGNYGTSYKTDEEGNEMKPAKQKGYGARQNYVRGQSTGEKKKMKESLSFTEMLELYNEHGLKVLAPIETEEMDIDGTTVEVIDADKVNGVVETIVEEPTEEEFNKEFEDQKASFEGKKKQPKVAAGKTVGVKNMPESVELDERTLTSGESKKKEEYVKGMKKKLSGFKQRYGERAKEVMYATATKMAKKD